MTAAATPPRTGTAARAARRAELLDAADVVVRRDGPDASMTAIAAGAGITKLVLYRHFEDKAGLYRALAQRYVAPLREGLTAALADAPPGQHRLRTALDTYIRFVEEDPQVYRFLLHRAAAEEPAARTTVADFQAEMADQVATALHDPLGLGLDADRARVWGDAVVGATQFAADRWLDGKDVPRAELVEQLVALLGPGLERMFT